MKNDPSDYVRLTALDKAFTVTPTCASNLLGIIPPDDSAAGNMNTIRASFSVLGGILGISPEAAAEQLMDKSFPRAANAVEDLIVEYQLDRNLLTLSGGGGGAPALAPYTAKKMALPFALAPNAPVISAIGAALAMVRDVIERGVVDPSDKDILKIRKEAEEAVVKMGAHPESVEVQVEIDPQKNLVRAIATGSTELRTRDLSKAGLSMEELASIVRQSIRLPIEDLSCVGEASGLFVYRIDTREKKFLGLVSSSRSQYRIIDRDGVIRLQISMGDAIIRQKREMESALGEFIERHTEFGDAGRSVPNFFLLFRGRILDLSGLLTAGHITSLARVELARLSDEEPVAALVKIL